MDYGAENKASRSNGVVPAGRTQKRIAPNSSNDRNKAEKPTTVNTKPRQGTKPTTVDYEAEKHLGEHCRVRFTWVADARVEGSPCK